LLLEKRVAEGKVLLTKVVADWLVWGRLWKGWISDGRLVEGRVLEVEG
jgi:hypothetical protein